MSEPVKNTPPVATSPHAQFAGEVVKAASRKTIQVVVATVTTHQKYRKQYTKRRRFAVHDEKGVAHVGDMVIFQACRPISKTKRWQLVRVIKSTRSV